MCLINLSELSVSFNNNKKKSKIPFTTLRADLSRDDDDDFFRILNANLFGTQD